MRSYYIDFLLSLSKKKLDAGSPISPGVNKTCKIINADISTSLQSFFSKKCLKKKDELINGQMIHPGDKNRP